MDYDRTPSFYNDEETFNQYIGYTSYYRAHQSVVTNLARMTGARNILEYGCAGGHTSRALVDTLCRRGVQDFRVTGVDLRPHILEEAARLTVNPAHQLAIRYLIADMESPRPAIDPADFDFSFLLYAFHHIRDPLSRKEDWLREQKAMLRPGAWLVIADFFLPEDDGAGLREVWTRCAMEARRSTRYSILETIPRWDAEAVEHINRYGEFSFRTEIGTVESILTRQDEFLVKRSWLRDAVARAGFSLEFEFEINEINDAVFLLRA